MAPVPMAALGRMVSACPDVMASWSRETVSPSHSVCTSGGGGSSVLRAIPATNEGRRLTGEGGPEGWVGASLSSVDTLRIGDIAYRMRGPLLGIASPHKKARGRFSALCHWAHLVFGLQHRALGSLQRKRRTWYIKNSTARRRHTA